MLSNNLMSYCLNFFVYVKIIMMNLDTAIDTFLSPIADKISEAFYGLQDVGRDVSNELDTMEWDENRLDEIEARLETIHQLKRKYGDSIPQILAYFEKISAELDEMQQVNSDSSEQEESVKKARSAKEEKPWLKVWKKRFIISLLNFAWIKPFLKSSFLRKMQLN